MYVDNFIIRSGSGKKYVRYLSRKSYREERKVVLMISLPGKRNSRKPVSSDRISLADSLYSEIHDRIITWQIAPNEILVTAQLAEEFKVSKMPVPEALTLLSQEGLVEVLPRVGYRVTSISIADAHEIFDLRLLLEPEAATIAANRATKGEALALLETNRMWLEKLAQKESFSSIMYLRFHDSFHMGVANLSENHRLARFISILLRDSARVRMSDPLMNTRGVDEDRELPEQLTRALIERNEEEARKLLYQHIADSKRRILSQLMNSQSKNHRIVLGKDMA